MRKELWVDNKSSGRSFYTILFVMFLTFLSRIFGFLKFVVVSAVFGGQGLADVVNSVLSIPNNLRKLLAEGALSTAFIPIINKKLIQNDLVGARSITSKILGLQWIILFPIVAVIMIFPQYTVHLFLSFSNPQQMILSGKFLFFVAPYIIIVCLNAVFMAVLNSHDRFFISAISPVIFSFAIGACVFLLSKILGIFSIAVGVLLGGCLQLLTQYLACYQLGYRFLPKFSLVDSDLKSLIKTWIPVLSVAVIFFLNQQIAIFLASRLSTGSSSALANSIVFFQLPFGIFSASVNTFYYPRLTRYVHQKSDDQIRKNLTDGLSLLMIFLVPSSFIFCLLGREIISIAFMRGAFQLKHVLLTARTLTGFSVGMFFMAACNFLQKYFYANNNVKSPLLITIFTCILDVLLSLLLMNTSLGVAGLAYANSFAFFVSFLMLLGILYKKNIIEFMPLLKECFKVLLILLVAFGVYLLLQRYFGKEWWQDGSNWVSFGILVLYGSILGIVILGGYFMFHMRKFV